MNRNRCPDCGEHIPSTAKTCPKCYRTISGKPVSDKQSGRTYEKTEKGKDETLAFLLAVIPGIFGVQGLGLIYLNPENRRGWHFLIVGLILFLSLLVCASWWDGVGSFTRVLLMFAMIILALIYISSYLAQLAETKFGTVFGLFRL